MTFEELVVLLEKTSNPYQLTKHMADIVAGMRNLSDRFDVVERSRVDDMHRMQELEIVTKAEKDEISAVAKDRTDLQKQVAETQQRLVVLEGKAKDVPIAGTAVHDPDPPRYDAHGTLITAPYDSNAKYYDRQGNLLPARPPAAGKPVDKYSPFISSGPIFPPISPTPTPTPPPPPAG